MAAHTRAETCWDIRTGDHRPCGWNPANSGSSKAHQQYLRELELRRQEEERERKARLREESQRREAAKRDRAERLQMRLEAAKTEAESLLKLGNGDQAGPLPLKSGTPSFAIKPNPSGSVRVAAPGAVAVGPSPDFIVSPAFFTRPKQRLVIREVPNPMQGRKGTWIRYVKSDRAGLILDALEEGNGDLEGSISYLEQQIVVHGANMIATSALSYLEGLRISYIAAGQKVRAAKSDQRAIAIESAVLLDTALANSGPWKWPGDKRPDDDPPTINEHDWRVKRTSKLLTALRKHPNDLEAVYQSLLADQEAISSANAEYYLRGIFAYWDYLDEHEQQ